jgi:uncharacterized protein with PQ loop repeat
MLSTNIIGWIGAFLLLLAYFLLVHKDLTGRSKTYQILNILGALMLGIHTFTAKAYPSFLTNIIWTMIGLYGLFHIVKQRKTKKK